MSNPVYLDTVIEYVQRKTDLLVTSVEMIYEGIQLSFIGKISVVIYITGSIVCSDPEIVAMLTKRNL